MNAALLEALFEIVTRAYAAIAKIRAGDPAAYAAVEQHIVDASTNAREEALKS